MQTFEEVTYPFIIKAFIKLEHKKTLQHNKDMNISTDILQYNMYTFYTMNRTQNCTCLLPQLLSKKLL